MADPSTSEFLDFQAVVAGRYSLDREIGRGGMGIVYLAQEVRLERPVALKLLPPAYAVQSALRERFLREARTAAKLSHPHIVPIHAVDEVDDFVFIAMAYVDGQTLGERIRERGPVAPREAARILRDVAWALGYAHAQGVVHRDVKPDNILLEAETGRALVTDFGIAHVADGPGVTMVGEVLGTAEFMSPEQATGDSVDKRSDIYSLGVVGHYMLSGRLPFEGGTVAATLAKHITQAAPALGSVAPEVPMHLTEAMDRCLAKDPEERFAGGEELAEMLNRALGERREMPAALRVFVSEHRDRMNGAMGVLFLVLYFLAGGIALLFEADLFVPGLAAIAFGSVMLAAPVGMVARMVRQLLREGHGRDELILALERDLRARREDLASQLGAKPAWYDHLAVGLTYGGLGVAALATVAMFLIDSVGGTMAALGLLVAGGGVSMFASPFAATAYHRRRRVSGGQWIKFWESRVGRWIFKLAGMGLDRLPTTAGSYRPTEVAIEMAAERLFEDLPKDVRASFGELPDLVRTLRAHAEGMRARAKDLSEILRDVEESKSIGGAKAVASTAPDVTAKRASLAEEVRQAREAANERMADAVAALETIRLGLLRLHAGAGSVEGLTADLGSARELAEDIQRLIDGSADVDALLGP